MGLDISREMLLEAGYEIELIEGDMEEIPIKNGIFDVVLCINAFRYSEDPEKMVLEVRRVMKPGGKFILVDGDRDNVEKRKEIMEKHPLEKILLGKEGIKKLYTSKEIKKFLEMYGFRVNVRKKGVYFICECEK
ncbi:MAG: class I SAM-dependent methyltransferase [Candidatus Syntropharchaeia archaeon]